MDRVTVHFRSGKTMQGIVNSWGTYLLHIRSNNHDYVIPYTSIEWVKYETD